MSLSTDLDSQLVDVTRMPLSELRTLRDPRLLEAIRAVVRKVPRSEHEEIQEQAGARLTDS